MNKGEIARDTFKNGFNCAQAVLSAYCNNYGLDENIAKKISCGFGAGCARQSLTCGAVTGAYLVIGLKYGKSIESDNDARDKTYNMVNEFSKQFKDINGSINCSELLGCNLATPEGHAYYKDNNLNTKCTNYVSEACSILDKMEL
jgi:C_GCAxxG_C_C family probable redox protein